MLVHRDIFMERNFLAENLSCKNVDNFSSPAELKSAMSFSDAGMADCKVRRTGEDGLKG